MNKLPNDYQNFIALSRYARWLPDKKRRETWEELVTRLEARGTDSAERRAQRLALAQEEQAHAPNFDHRIVNHSVTQVLSELVSLAS